MTKKNILQYILLLAACFLAGCAAALLLKVIDDRSDAVTPIAGGQTIDLTEYGFTLTVPDGFSLADYTTNNHAEGGVALFAGCAFDEKKELYLFCYGNEAGDSISDYSEREMVSYYMRSGAQDVRMRSLGGRRFVCYSVQVAADTGTELWHTYETWDGAHQIVFETRMSPSDALPILATISFTD